MSATCCNAEAKNKNIPIETERYKKFFLSLLNSLKNLFFSIIKKKGTSARKPTKNLTPLNVKGPISSIPVSWAINVVPQIKQQTNALMSDSLFDI